ncbi:MAG: DUF1330 domain-containing protein [Pseudoxanthomonas sp.]
MPAYLIIAATITDASKFAAYAQQVPALVQRHGGHYRVMGGVQETLEGGAGGVRIVMSEWPDRAAAQAFWHSPEYHQLKKLREGCGSFNVRLVDGLPGSTE